MSPTAHPIRAINKWRKQTAGAIKELASDLPEAVRREYEYYTAKQSSAIMVLTWACTSRCKTCTAWRRPRNANRELTCQQWFDVGRELVAQGIRSVELFGGDVFLRKDVVIRLSVLLNSLGCKVRIPTNANLMDDHTARALVGSVYKFYISTDGVDESHDKVRGRSGTFDRVKKTIEILRQARGASPTPRLVCNTTVSRYNAHTLLAIARFAAGAGFDESEFGYVGEFTADHASNSCIGQYCPSPIYMRNGDSALVTAEMVPTLRNQLALAKNFADRCSRPSAPFKVEAASIDALSDTELVKGTVSGTRCFFERGTTMVDPYGNIIPCLFFDGFAVGNVRNGHAAHGSNTRARRRFREYRDSGRLALCRHCIMSVVRNRTGRDVLRRAYLTGKHLGVSGSKG